MSPGRLLKVRLAEGEDYAGQRLLMAAEGRQLARWRRRGGWSREHILKLAVMSEPPQPGDGRLPAVEADPERLYVLS